MTIPRAVIFLAILQITCLILGLLALGIVLKIHGYPAEREYMRFASLALLLRSQGSWLILATALWACYATKALQAERGVWSWRVAIILGVLIAGAVTYAFLYSCIFPVADGPPLILSTKSH